MTVITTSSIGRKKGNRSEAVSFSKLSRWPVRSTKYKGRPATNRDLDMRDEERPLILIDDAYSTTKGDKILIAARIPKEQRKDFRTVSDRYNKPTKDGHERKYSNSETDMREQIFGNLSNIRFEITDTFDLDIPKDFERRIPIRFQGKMDERGKKYIYQTYVIIREIIRRHPGSVDIVMDNPPYEIYDELMELCNLLIAQGYSIVWYTVTPSGTLQELWVVDFVAGLNRDILDDNIEGNQKMKRKTSDGSEIIPDGLRDSIQKIGEKRRKADFGNLDVLDRKQSTETKKNGNMTKKQKKVRN